MIIILCIALIVVAAIGGFLSVDNVKLTRRLANARGNAERLAARLIDRNHEIERLRATLQPRTFVLSFQHRAAANELYRLGLNERDPRVILATNPRHLEGRQLQPGDRLVTIAPPVDERESVLDAWSDLMEVWDRVCIKGSMAGDQNYVWTIRL